MLRYALVALGCLTLTSASFAQVVYEPTRSQYQTPSGQAYFYGGVDPRVHAVAAAGNGYGDRCGFHGYAMNLHNFDGGNSFGQPMPMYERTPVFTDCIPFRDASRFGFTEADANNEARANTPTYFRKIDLLASAIPTDTGGWVVPSNAPYVYVAPGMTRADIYGVRPATRGVTTNPASRPGQVIIIPKRLMDKKIKDLDQKPLKVASAK
jgi:hypothetical protein